MRNCPRRTIIGSIGAALGAGVFGSAVTAGDPQQRTSAPGSAADDANTVQSDGGDPDSLLPYLPASLEDEQLAVTAVDVAQMETANTPNEYTTPMRYRDAIDDVDAIVSVQTFGESFSQPLTVLAGTAELPGEPVEETDAYDRYDLDRGAAAVLDDVTLFAEEVDTLEAAVDAGAGDEDRLLEAMPTLEDGLEAYDDAALRMAASGNEHIADQLGVDLDDIRFLVRAVTVVDEDTLEVRFVVEFTDEDYVTDDTVEALEQSIPADRHGEMETSTDGARIVVTAVRDLAAERRMREHDSPSGLMTRSVDLDGEYIDVEIRRGDPTPVEDLTLEVGGEEYEKAIWADGAETIEAGDRIRIRTEDVEPNLRVELTHEMEYGTHTSGTRLLSHFRFDFEYDPAGTLAIEYADDFPLDGDEIYVGVVDEDRYYRNERTERTTRPWAGQELTAGDAASIDDVEPGQTVVVGYGGTDFESALARYRVEPPGHVSFDYDAESGVLEATLEVTSDQPASAYELRVDDEPASTQWADEFDTITDEATVECSGLEYGTRVTVRWGDDELWVGSTTVLPSVEIELVEDEDGDVAVEHAGGEAVPVDDLELGGWSGEDRITVDVSEELDGTFAEGDRIPLGVETVEYVALRYGHYGIAYAMDRSHR